MTALPLDDLSALARGAGSGLALSNKKTIGLREAG
jgi:hypothetical protein